eukprot:TRINITY_DN23038_c0_g1_i1.p1 TRINITY_DN23038_c0_g1~~TRINITY_DN23038_c0_g1_i1.p1  ORF type:complete len:195 (+),score=41.81 TRINITY_DN23038_c0_g1_i1:116-700(+)
MSTRRGGVSHGPPAHQNKSAFVPDRGLKKKGKEVGGSLGYTYGPIRGICNRCKDIIEWKRKYGKYKPLVEAQKCKGCGKRAVRQAYHSLCTACSTEKNVCAKCMIPAPVVGREEEQAEKGRKELEQALGTLRERDRRTLLRVMEKGGTAKTSTSKQTEGQGNESTAEGPSDGSDFGEDSEDGMDAEEGNSEDEM